MSCWKEHFEGLSTSWASSKPAEAMAAESVPELEVLSLYNEKTILDTP